jgi:hypothetical protein
VRTFDGHAIFTVTENAQEGEDSHG